MRNVRGKMALVTGAASGIGRATAVEFARNGADVVLVDINESSLQDALGEVRLTGARGWTYVCDVSDRSAMENLSNKVMADTGGIDILMNCAGVGVASSRRTTTIKRANCLYMVTSPPTRQSRD